MSLHGWFESALVHVVVISHCTVVPPSCNKSTLKGDDFALQYSELSFEAMTYSVEGIESVMRSIPLKYLEMSTFLSRLNLNSSEFSEKAMLRLWLASPGLDEGMSSDVST